MLTLLAYTAGVILFILALFVSIGLHEMGHLKVARRFGCRVSEYMIGFGPTLFSFTRGETEYGLKLIPLGGYVTIIGMFPPGADGVGTDAEGNQVVRLRRSNTGMFAQIISQTRSENRRMITEADTQRLFYKLPWYKKVAVMGAGPAVNLVISFCCFLGVFSIYGVYDTQPTGTTTVTSVGQCVTNDSATSSGACPAGDEQTPAAKAGIQPGDRIISMNGSPISTWPQLQQRIHSSTKHTTASFVVEREGKRIALPAVPMTTVETDGTTVGYLGVEPDSVTTFSRKGPIYTIEQMGQMAGHSARAILTLPQRVFNVALAIVGVEHRDADGPMSVIGGSRVAGEVAAANQVTTGLGVQDKVAMLTGLVGSFNLFLGLLNLVPLLPLDGGHIIGALWEGLRRALAKLRRRPDPGFVDVAAQMPIAFIIGISMAIMGVVLMLGDIVVPLRTGL